MKKTLLILGIALTSLIACQKSPTFEECSIGVVTDISPDFDYENPDPTKSNWVIVIVRNNCSGNEKELRLNSNLSTQDKPYYNYESNGDILTLNKPW